MQVRVWPAWYPRRILVTWSGHFGLEMNVLYRSFPRLFAALICEAMVVSRICRTARESLARRAVARPHLPTGAPWVAQGKEFF